MEQKRKNLIGAMNLVGIDEGTLQAMKHLSKTADKTGILPFSLEDEDTQFLILKLVELAQRYGYSVPPQLKVDE